MKGPLTLTRKDLRPLHGRGSATLRGALIRAPTLTPSQADFAVTPYTLHLTPYALHLTHSTLYTLHRTPYPPHLTPYIYTALQRSPPPRPTLRSRLTPLILQQQPLWFFVFKAHRLVYRSTLGSRVMKKKKECGWAAEGGRASACYVKVEPTLTPSQADFAVTP